LRKVTKRLKYTSFYVILDKLIKKFNNKYLKNIMLKIYVLTHTFILLNFVLQHINKKDEQ